MKKIFFLLLLHFVTFYAAQADLVIFSYDRPLQLYALLESVEKYMIGLGEVHVIYRASNDAFSTAYDEVRKVFPAMQFIKQGDSPTQDFKPLTLNCVFGSPNEHVLFASDDIIVKDYVDLIECVGALEATSAYGFYLRLGTHICRSYSRYGDLEMVPQFTHIKNNIYTFNFVFRGYFGYPNTVDMALYRKSDIADNLISMNYGNPNDLEGDWARRGRAIKKTGVGLCYELSKIVNLPFNKVNKENKNRAMNIYTTQELLDVFNRELKIDIEPLFHIKNESAHIEYEPIFIAR